MSPVSSASASEIVAAEEGSAQHFSNDVHQSNTTATATATTTPAATKKQSKTKTSTSTNKSKSTATKTSSPSIEPKKTDDDTSEDSDDNNHEEKGWGVQIWCRITLILFLVLIGLGVAVYFVGGFNESSSSSNANTNTDRGIDTLESGVNEQPTDAPTLSTKSPSLSPSVTPGNPTATPSYSPSDEPSESPSDDPSSAPSDLPSNLPTQPPTQSPTNLPTATPTDFFVPPNPVPLNPPQGYFNYDIDDMQYGPLVWDRVDTRNHWLREFDSDGFGVYRGHLDRKDVTDNKCGDVVRRQSPKDLVEIIPCEAYHEIRSRCASANIPTENFEILPHTLRVQMPRRPCLDDSKPECNKDRPPMADYPRYSSFYTPWSDLLHLDLKFPGEHTFEGQRFDAEMQLFHTHLTPDPQRVSSIGVPIQATSDGFNPEFQLLLNFFQFVSDSHAAECEDSQLRKRRALKRDLRVAQGLPEDAFDEEELLWEATRKFNATDHERIARKLLFPPKFNPYSEAFLRDIFFFRYDGSITEPPCLDITWWVMIDPMYISYEQLEMGKRILFTHIDPQCQPTSVHNAKMEVVRPIQPLGEDRVIQRCQRGSFESDIEKGHGNGNKC